MECDEDGLELTATAPGGNEAYAADAEASGGGAYTADAEAAAAHALEEEPEPSTSDGRRAASSRQWVTGYAEDYDKGYEGETEEEDAWTDYDGDDDEEYRRESYRSVFEIVRCNVCPRTFKNKDLLASHVLTHRIERPCVCQLCGWAFAQNSDLNSHLRTVHGTEPYVRIRDDEKPRACGACGLTFPTVGRLYAHMRLGHREEDIVPMGMSGEDQQVSLVENQYQRLQLQLQQQQLNPMPVAHEKSLPPKKRVLFNMHMQKKNEALAPLAGAARIRRKSSEFPCEICGKIVFGSLHKFLLHKKRVHGIADATEGSTVPQERVAEEKTMQVASSAIKETPLVVLHQKRAPKKYGRRQEPVEERTCAICQRVLSQARWMRRHLKMVHRIKQERTAAESKPQATDNNRGISVKKSAQRSGKSKLRRKPGDGSSTLSGVGSAKPKRYVKPVSVIPENAVSGAGENFNVHQTRKLQLHKVIKPYACLKCGSKFGNTSARNQHMRKLHGTDNVPGLYRRLKTSEMHLRCGLCGKEFNSRQAIKDHLENVPFCTKEKAERSASKRVSSEREFGGESEADPTSSLSNVRVSSRSTKGNRGAFVGVNLTSPRIEVSSQVISPVKTLREEFPSPKPLSKKTSAVKRKRLKVVEGADAFVESSCSDQHASSPYKKVIVVLKAPEKKLLDSLKAKHARIFSGNTTKKVETKSRLKLIRRLSASRPVQCEAPAVVKRVPRACSQGVRRAVEMLLGRSLTPDKENEVEEPKKRKRAASSLSSASSDTKRARREVNVEERERMLFLPNNIEHEKEEVGTKPPQRFSKKKRPLEEMKEADDLEVDEDSAMVNPGTLKRCNVCRESFNGLRSLALHRRNVHKDRSLYHCTDCNVPTTFATSTGLLLHRRNCHVRKVYSCRFCTKTFTQYSNRVVHVRRFHGQVSSPDASTMSSVRTGDLSVTEMNTPKKDHTKASEVKKKVYVCGMCNHEFRDKEEYRRHRKSHFSIGKEEKVVVVRPSTIVLGTPEQVKKNRTPVVPMTRTSKRLASAGRVRRNILLTSAYASPILSGSHPPVRATKGTKTHVDQVVLESEERPKKIRVDSGFQCDKCPKVFRLYSQLVPHYRSHTGSRPFRCDACDSRFLSLSNLINHRKLTHKDHSQLGLPKPVVVLKDSANATNTTLQNNADVQIRSSKRRKLQAAIRSSQKEVAASVFVPRGVIKRSGRRRKRLTPRFGNTKLGKQERASNRCCQYCLKVCKTPSLLLTHLRCHTGERPYVCKFCDLAFKTSFNVKTHCRSIHNRVAKFRVVFGNYLQKLPPVSGKRTQVRISKKEIPSSSKTVQDGQNEAEEGSAGNSNSQIKSLIGFSARLHAQAYPVSYCRIRCIVCGRIFKSRKQLNEHRMVHRLKDDIPKHPVTTLGSASSCQTTSPKDNVNSLDEKPETVGENARIMSTVFKRRRPLDIQKPLKYIGRNRRDSVDRPSSGNTMGSAQNTTVTVNQNEDFSDVLGSPIGSSSMEEVSTRSLPVSRSADSEKHLIPRKVVEQTTLNQENSDDDIVEIKVEDVPNKGQFTCQICKRSFINSYRLKLHLSIHAMEELHACQVCGQKFTMKPQLAVHMKIHRNQLSYGCSCGNSFDSLKMLEEHRLTTHPERCEPLAAISVNSLLKPKGVDASCQTNDLQSIPVTPAPASTMGEREIEVTSPVDMEYETSPVEKESHLTPEPIKATQEVLLPASTWGASRHPKATSGAVLTSSKTDISKKSGSGPVKYRKATPCSVEVSEQEKSAISEVLGSSLATELVSSTNAQAFLSEKSSNGPETQEKIPSPTLLNHSKESTGRTEPPKEGKEGGNTAHEEAPTLSYSQMTPVPSTSSATNGTPCRSAPVVAKRTIPVPTSASASFSSPFTWLRGGNETDIFFPVIPLDAGSNSGPSPPQQPSNRQSSSGEKHAKTLVKIASSSEHLCDVCLAHFESKQLLASHRKAHIRERPHRCDLCMMSFISNDAHEAHHVKRHPGLPRNQCGICKQVLSSSPALAAHKSAFHGLSSLLHKPV